ncbi:MAG: ABC transporter permease [Anaerolineaceae bacterium]
MNKTRLILKNELITTIMRPSFIVSLLIFPVIMAIVIYVQSATNMSSSSPAITALTGQTGESHEGYVDESGLIKAYPPEVKDGMLAVFPDITSANAALSEGLISGYYVVPQDFITSGRISYVRADYNPLSGLEASIMFRDVLDFNLMGQDLRLADRFWNPIRVEEITLQKTVKRDVTNPMTFMIPYFVGLILYIVIITSASLLLNSITTEKQSRVMELLMASSSPLQILAGKIIALGLVGLLQTIIWSGTGLIVVNLFNKQSDLTAVMQLPFSLIFWVIVYFLLGYAIYAALMAGVGALVPGMKEASQATMLVVMPLLIPLVLSPSLSMTPDNTLSVVLSLIPFTAPVSMMSRLAAGPVPAWQLGLSIALMVITATLTIRSVAGMFRAQALLTGQSFNLVLFFKALLGKA